MNEPTTRHIAAESGRSGGGCGKWLSNGWMDIATKRRGMGNAWMKLIVSMQEPYEIFFYCREWSNKGNVYVYGNVHILAKVMC